MPAKIPDLWSDDISVDVLTPLAILRAQVQGLERRTQGVLEVQISSVPKGNDMEHWFDLVAPALGFRERILNATHAWDRVYPVKVEAACFAAKGKLTQTALSQEEFVDLIREVLRSGEVRSSIQSLIARSNEAKGVSAPPAAAEEARPNPTA
jgi:hypothetical protein